MFLTQIRVQLSREFIQDLGLVKEENQALLQETLMVGLGLQRVIDGCSNVRVLSEGSSPEGFLLFLQQHVQCGEDSSLFSHQKALVFLNPASEASCAHQ